MPESLPWTDTNGDKREGALEQADAAVVEARRLIDKCGPVSTVDGELMAGGVRLANDMRIVDAIKSELGFGCTIFHGNVRVATTAVAAGGVDRAIGTAANDEITQRVFRSGQSFRGTTRTIGKDWVIVYVPLREHTGKIVGMIAAYRELFDFLEDATALDVPEAILLHNGAGRILDVNRAACDMLGFAREDLLRLRLQQFTVGQTIDWSRAADQQAAVETFWRRADKHLFAVELSVCRAPANAAAPLLSIARDFTERYKARRKLRELNEELKQTNARLRVAERKALEASETKSGFLANMSHELRTPLNAILGYSEMMIEDATKVSAGELVPDLERVHGAGAHLLALINNILDIAKIEAGRMDVLVEAFNLSTMLTQTSAALLPLIRANDNRLVVQVEPSVGTVFSDKTKVTQCVFNMVSNAAKFTAGGTLTVHAWRNASTILISVKDTGIGMTPEQLSRVFDEFQQAEASTTRDYGGTGLGLALVKKLTELLGGGVTAESVKGQGSEFVLEFRDQTD